MSELSQFEKDMREYDKLKIWLRNQSTELVAILTIRAAARLLPYLTRVSHWGRPLTEEQLTQLVLPVLRAHAANWYTLMHMHEKPEVWSELRGAANSSLYAAMYANRKTHIFAGIVALSVDSAARALLIIEDKFSSSEDSPNAATFAGQIIDVELIAKLTHKKDIRAAWAKDIVYITENADNNLKVVRSNELAKHNIWLHGAPNWFEKDLAKMKSSLTTNQYWDVWKKWIDQRILGGSEFDELEAFCIKQSDKFWKQPTSVINKAIQNKDTTYEEIETSNPKKVSKTYDHEWDYFISYSTLDEVVAREVGATLEAAGYTIFAQYKHFTPGRDWVTEMNRGLKGAKRFVALYSLNYFKSDNCQKEWGVAYSEDPSGRYCKIVAYLIAQTDIQDFPPLSRTVVFKPIWNLSADERTTAIIEATRSEANH